MTAETLLGALAMDLHVAYCERSAVAMRRMSPQETAHQVEAFVLDRMPAIIAAARGESDALRAGHAVYHGEPCRFDWCWDRHVLEFPEKFSALAPPAPAPPPSPETVRHASGDDIDGCAACYQDGDGSSCYHPERDPEEPGVCRWCSHTVEAA
jgi:hypothetical protein